MPTMLSVPPRWGAPVPGLSPCQPAVTCCAAGVVPEVPLDELHAAASMVRATAPAKVAKARVRKCVTTLFLLNLLGEDRSRENTGAPWPHTVPPAHGPRTRPSTAMAN